MLDSDGAEGGWGFVAEHEGAARVLGALVEADPGETYTQSEIADLADVPLKTLYLNDLIDEYVDLGVLAEATDPDEYEVEYRVRTDGEVLRAATAFDDAVDERLPE